jgi:hypothetical protein
MSEPTPGPQYGCFGLLALCMVAPVALIFGAASVFLGAPAAAPIGTSVVTFLAAAWFHRKSFITVNDEGVSWTFANGMSGPFVPWADIDRVDAHRLSAWVVRKSSGRRVLFAALDPWWSHRPMAKAILSRVQQAAGTED